MMCVSVCAITLPGVSLHIGPKAPCYFGQTIESFPSWQDVLHLCDMSYRCDMMLYWKDHPIQMGLKQIPDKLNHVKLKKNVKKCHKW